MVEMAKPRNSRSSTVRKSTRNSLFIVSRPLAAVQSAAFPIQDLNDAPPRSQAAEEDLYHAFSEKVRDLNDTLPRVCESAPFPIQNLNDAPPRSRAAEEDLYQAFSEKVRDLNDLESRWAVLQETRVEYFRGKDFVSFLTKHPELKEVLELDKSFEAEDIVNVLLRHNLLVRCDRAVKTIRPGKTKLATWPAHLEIFPDQVFSETDAFYAWTFVKRRPLWQTILSFVWPVLILAICLFPVFPYRCKLLLMYSWSGLLFLILSLFSLRFIIFGVLWIFLGKHVWFFPNLFVDNTTLSELFKFWPKNEELEIPKRSSRFFCAVGLAAFFICLLMDRATEEDAKNRDLGNVSDIIADVIEWVARTDLPLGLMDQFTLQL